MSKHHLSCTVAREQILLGSEGGGLGADALEAHLVACGACKNLAAEQRRLWTLLASAAPPTPAASAGFTSRVMAACAAELTHARSDVPELAVLSGAAGAGPSAKSSMARPAWRARLVLAAAAGLVVVAGVTFQLSERGAAADPGGQVVHGGSDQRAGAEEQDSLGDVLAEVPEQDRLIVALLHLDEQELELVGEESLVALEIEDASGVEDDLGTGPEDDLAFLLASEVGSDY